MPRILQDHLLPSEYVVCMRDNMLDRCPVSTYEQVRHDSWAVGRQRGAAQNSSSQRSAAQNSTAQRSWQG
jgi:hypothetical protein